MSIRIEIGANSTKVNTAQTTADNANSLALEAKGIAQRADGRAGDAIDAVGQAVDKLAEHTADITTINNQLSTISGDVSDALEEAQRAAAAADSADGKAAEALGKAETALQEIEEWSGSGISEDDREAINIIKQFPGTHQGVSITEYVNGMGETLVTVENNVGDLGDACDNLATNINTINQNLADQDYTRSLIQNAVNGWENPPIATQAMVDDKVSKGMIAAENSIIQEVGDMIEGVRDLAGDDIDINALAIPTEESENSSNESFNELVAKLQEKPVRRSDVLKKVIDEDAFYWYVMPIIDQRIYRDTVVNGVVVEAGWQKAIKERYWYHKQDTDIRDHYIYLYRSDINLNATKATEENTAANNKPNVLPLAGNPRTLRKNNELPSGLAIIGQSIIKNDRKINPTITPADTKTATRDLYVVTDALTMKSGHGEALPLKKRVVTPSEITLNGGKTTITQANRKLMPYKTIKKWFTEPGNNQNKKKTDPVYPADFLYIGCYAECDDSSMYEKRWYKLIAEGEHAGEADTTIGPLHKHDDGTYYYTEGDIEHIVDKEDRAEFYVDMETGDNTRTVVGPLWKLGDPNVVWSQLTRRTFADVSRDIKVHMLPIYIPGSTIIAEHAVSNNDMVSVSIDSMLTPTNQTSQDGKRSTVNENEGLISLGYATAIKDNDNKTYVCKDNVRMAESGLPCVYGQGYTWLPLDAKGEADDEGGLGIHCSFTQSDMWVADGVYSEYNGKITSGYTKETLKNLATLYKYKIVENFVIGQWSEENGKLVWTNNEYSESSDGRIHEYTDPETGKPTCDTTHPADTRECTVNIFVEDYSEDNIADLNEEIFDINIDDEYITYTIKDGLMVQNDPSGGATVSNFIYDTLSYLTQKGTVNTNNIFLFCIEDDGDEYIFDEYIWEKGKVLKLNEQKRIKYSEDLRKVEYVQANNLPLSNPDAKRIGHEGTFEGQTVHAYNGVLVGGVDSQGQPLKTKDEQADLIIRYLSILTQKDTGATIKNPSYVPSVEGNFIWNAITNEAEEGYTSTSDQMYSNSSVTEYFTYISQGGVISNIAAAIKQYIIQLVTNKKDISDLKNAFSYYFGNDEYAIGIMNDYSYHASEDIEYIWHTYIRPNICNPTGNYIDSTYAAGDSDEDTKREYDSYYNSDYDYPDYYTRDDYFKIKMEMLRQTYTQMYESDPASVIPTIIDTIFGEVGDIEDPGYDPDNYTNNLSGLLIGLYKKMTDIGNGSKDNGAKDESAEMEYEGGMPAQVEPAEEGEEGEEQDPQEIRASLDWIIQNYHNEKLYLIEFLILNKILGIMFSSKMESQYQYDFNNDFETEEFLKTFEECLLKIIEDLNNLLKSYGISDAVKEGFEKFVEIKEAFKTVFEDEEAGYKEEYAGKFDEEKYGILTGFDICITAETLSIYNDYIPSQGGPEYIPVTTDVWVPITTTGGDYLQKYNKILAFLIDKQSVGSGSNGYEWTYSLWRYMPSSKQYATVGTVSTISVNEPDLNSKDLESEVGSANNTDTHSEISNAIKVAREDIIQRFDKLLTEEGILSKLPKLNAILEQNFLTKEVGGQRIYTLKNAVTTADLDVAFRKQHDIETSMSTLVSAMNSGKRASFVNGVMTKSQENIYEIDQKGGDISIAVVETSLPTPSASETVITPTPTGDPVQNNAASKSSGRYFVDNTGGSATARRRIFI